MSANGKLAQAKSGTILDNKDRQTILEATVRSAIWTAGEVESPLAGMLQDNLPGWLYCNTLLGRVPYFVAKVGAETSKCHTPFELVKMARVDPWVGYLQEGSDGNHLHSWKLKGNKRKALCTVNSLIPCLQVMATTLHVELVPPSRKRSNGSMEPISRGFVLNFIGLEKWSGRAPCDMLDRHVQNLPDFWILFSRFSRIVDRLIIDQNAQEDANGVVKLELPTKAGLYYSHQPGNIKNTRRIRPGPFLDPSLDKSLLQGAVSQRALTKVVHAHFYGEHPSPNIGLISGPTSELLPCDTTTASTTEVSSDTSSLASSAGSATPTMSGVASSKAPLSTVDSPSKSHNKHSQKKKANGPGPLFATAALAGPNSKKASNKGAIPEEQKEDIPDEQTNVTTDPDDDLLCVGGGDDDLFTSVSDNSNVEQEEVSNSDNQAVPPLQNRVRGFNLSSLKPSSDLHVNAEWPWIELQEYFHTLKGTFARKVMSAANGSYLYDAFLASRESGGGSSVEGTGVDEGSSPSSDSPLSVPNGPTTVTEYVAEHPITHKKVLYTAIENMMSPATMRRLANLFFTEPSYQMTNTRENDRYRRIVESKVGVGYTPFYFSDGGSIPSTNPMEVDKELFEFVNWIHEMANDIIKARCMKDKVNACLFR